MRNVVTFILGGGRGSRLYPLTKYRAKPAVPLGGKYRLIDIPLSNCIHSGLTQIYVLTQFLSVSLHRHLRQTYRFDQFSSGFVELLAAQQTEQESTDWYQGTADAVRKNLEYLRDPGIDYVLILSGDQLYRMDYRELINTHIQTGAGVTIAGLPVSREQAAGLGIMKLDDAGRIQGFVEKPKTDKEIEPVRMQPEWFRRQGIEAGDRELLGNMGIYLFNRDLLLDLLDDSAHQDFGHHVFPKLVDRNIVQAHVFDGYWEDIGTVRAFYEANLALARENAPFQFASRQGPIFTRARFLPPARVSRATVSDSLLADGCTVGAGSTLENSVIGIRCRVGNDVTIRESIVFGDDDHGVHQLQLDDRAGRAGAVAIGAESVIVGAIVEKNVRIGKNVRIVNTRQVQDSGEMPLCIVRDGIPCVLRGAVLPDGWSLDAHLAAGE